MIENAMGDRNGSPKPTLFGKTRKKNDYRKLEAGAYPRMFLQQLEEAAKAIAKDDFSNTRMVRLDIRTGKHLITIGFGKRNTWFPNDFLGQGEVAECENADEAFRAIMRLTKAARAGAFDLALEDLRIQRQEHAEKMILKRGVCGFHDTETMERVNHSEGDDS